MWILREESFKPDALNHAETIFTIGNGYLSTRGAFEEPYPGERRATLIHGVFDAAPVVFTQLVNAPDWLPLSVYLNGERFSLYSGKVEEFERTLDLRTGLLVRTLRWVSPAGHAARLTFERFTSLADEHLLALRCRVVPEFDGEVEFRTGLNSNMHNEGLTHWDLLGQGQRGTVQYLHCITRCTREEVAAAFRFGAATGELLADEVWDVDSLPTRRLVLPARTGEEIVVEKMTAVYTSRDPVRGSLPEAAAIAAQNAPGWQAALEASTDAWSVEWERADVIIEGDDEAQLAIRFNLFQLLIAAPRHDDRVNIGAKSLSGFGYHGHSFWDTETFMLPFFIHTSPHIAKNLLNYRFQRLPAARQKAAANGFEGAQFSWESAGTGEEVTPTWVPDLDDRTRLIRIWTGDIEIHISADIAYAAHQYWQMTGDDHWMIEKGAEIILDTAKFWASRAEWNPECGRYEYTDVIGPDEYHDHVDNNYYTNRMAQWNLQTALVLLEWLEKRDPRKAEDLAQALDLSETRLSRWREVIDKMYLPAGSDGLIEQFEGYFDLQDIDLNDYPNRTESMQTILGIDGANQAQIIKQPDVLMLHYLLPEDFSSGQTRINYNYYSPRTDHTYGSSLGPSMMAILACEAGDVETAYEHFIRAVRADLYDVRGNADDGIHAASAGGSWQAAVFGFGGLQIDGERWTTRPRLPRAWKRLSFRFFLRGKQHIVDIKADQSS